MNSETKQSEPTIDETEKLLARVRAGYKPTNAELEAHSENLKKFVAQKQGIDENKVEDYLKRKRRLRLMLNKPKRNKDCPCGSGLQYRKCCGKFSR